MKKGLFIFLLLAVCGALSAGARTYEIKTGDFSRLKVPNHLNVVHVCDAKKAGTAHYDCADSMADAIMFTSNGRDLKVQISPDFVGRENELPTVYVYSELLSEVESSSNKKVSVSGVPRCVEFKAVLMGNGVLDVKGIDAQKVVGALMTGHGVITLEGKTSDAVFKLAGTGDIQANELDAKKVTCHVFGTGNIHCSPVDELKLKGLGTTNVYYKGHPSKIKKQGVGNLIHVGD